ncbi:unnamed protein product [Lymnaea stagnalis]|uniref:Glycosyl hydrolase family 13 catalytic domain-containing protein n=1 Tax=Lymnaea stagnalis TaxID=6523 RepID=A0AAV2INU8_LYMST
MRRTRAISGMIVSVIVSAIVLLSRVQGIVVSTRANDQRAAADLSWWKKAVFYQIYPRSFQDSDGDGVGDLRGIISRLDYLKDLGIDCVWLSPICRSPMKDFGYDCSDGEDIDPIFGNLDDFKDLLDEVHNRSLKLIVDFVPGYTSDQHTWFRKSIKRIGKYTDYYVWDDGKLLPNGTRVPINNWLSLFGGSAWEWNDERQQYYYHVFIKEAPEMNHRNENVEWELKSLLRFWLDLGVDGFRADAVPNMVTVANLSWDEPLSGKDVPLYQDDYVIHVYTQHQPELVPIIKGWYDLLDEYTQQDGRERYMVLETYATHEQRNVLYSQGEANPFNFDLLQMSRPPKPQEINRTIMADYNDILPGKWPNFVLGNHDNTRVSKRNGAPYVDVYNMLLLTLWGTPTTYYGEEIGMLQAEVSWNETRDPWGLNYGPDRYQYVSRDPERSPMQWTDGPQAGFTTGNSTWLPLGVNYTVHNVKIQSEGPGQTSLKLYKQLVAIRRNKAFQEGTFKPLLVTDDVYAYVREFGDQRFLVVLNFGKAATVDLSPNDGQAGTAKAVTPSVVGIAQGDTVQLTSLKLGPGDGLILQLTKDQEIIG